MNLGRVYMAAPVRIDTARRRRAQRTKRHIADKLQEIVLRSPKDGRALDIVLDVILDRLNGQDTSPPDNPIMEP